MHPKPEAWEPEARDQRPEDGGTPDSPLSSGSSPGAKAKAKKKPRPVVPALGLGDIGTGKVDIS